MTDIDGRFDDMTEDEKELASLIWRTSRADEGTISATGANIIAKTITRQPKPERPSTGMELYFNAIKDNLIDKTGSPGLTSYSNGKVHMTLEEWARLVGAIPEPGYQCSQEPHPGVEHYGEQGGCAECGFVPNPLNIELLCEVMHDAYEKAAVGAGWETNLSSRKPWSDVPEANKETMRAAVSALFPYIEEKFLSEREQAWDACLKDIEDYHLNTEQARAGNPYRTEKK